MIRFIFEAYEGIAVATTMDAATGTIFLAVAPGCEAMVRDIMMDLGKDFLIEALPDDFAEPERGVHAHQISFY